MGRGYFFCNGLALLALVFVTAAGARGISPLLVSDSVGTNPVASMSRTAVSAAPIVASSARGWASQSELVPALGNRGMPVMQSSATPANATRPGSVSQSAPQPALAPVSKARRAVNDYNIVAYYNRDRASAGVAPLAWDDCLAGVARNVAQTMADRQVMAHGNGLQQDFACHHAATAENLARYTGPNENLAAVNTMWMNSSGHRQNIMNGAYKHVALAYAVDSNGEGYYAVELSA